MTETPDPGQSADDEPAWYLAYRRYRYDGPVWRRCLVAVAVACLISLVIALVLSSQ